MEATQPDSRRARECYGRGGARSVPREWTAISGAGAFEFVQRDDAALVSRRRVACGRVVAAADKGCVRLRRRVRKAPDPLDVVARYWRRCDRNRRSDIPAGVGRWI